MARRAPSLYAALMAAHDAGMGDAGMGGAVIGDVGIGDAGMGETGPAADARRFEAHTFASAIAVAAEEAEADDVTLAERLGLGADEIEALFARHFSPRALAALPVPTGRRAPDDEADLVRDLLLAHRRDGDEAHAWMAAVVARRAMLPDHLWQDLGLGNRGELSRLLLDHFPALAAGNVTNMKWKKFFYRRLCEAEGFALCTAPSCNQCSDFEACFGDESGESRLARTRRAVTLLPVTAWPATLPDLDGQRAR